ncbi:MAG: CoA pyrophosphatase [Thermodesulfobacteriota bacterium]|nr:CoA pyrophosphatase [Thermodesulfobacteriota bacterium]
MERKIKEILACRTKNCLKDQGLKRAAVLVPLFKKGGEYHILFTKRTDTVEHHKGQISFPGGRQDQKDQDLLNTALREAQEEMGIKKEDVHLLGELDDFLTATTDFCISPFVAFIPYPYPFKINPHEIEEVIEAPLLAFLDDDKFRQEVIVRNGEPFPVYFYQYQGHTIWGATARILKQLLDLLPEEEKERIKRKDPEVRSKNSKN